MLRAGLLIACMAKDRASNQEKILQFDRSDTQSPGRSKKLGGFRGLTPDGSFAPIV